MKRNTKFLFSLTIALLVLLSIVVVVSTCDMVDLKKTDTKSYDDLIESGYSGELNEDERDAFEKNGHYLKLINMPLHTQVPNVYFVAVANSSENIGAQKNNIVLIYKDKNSCTLYLPLVYSNKKSDFLETGNFFVLFEIHVDAITTFIVETEQEHIIVPFTDGRGTLDVNILTPIATDIPYLTIKSLPTNTAKHHISDVFLHNNVNPVARCPNYNEIIITNDGVSATVYIPLVYYSGSKTNFFRDTGIFKASFSVNFDIYSQIIKQNDGSITVSCLNGNGSIDMSDDFGFFNGNLTNYADFNAPPVVEKDTVFEMNGSYYTITKDTTVSPFTFTRSCLVYIYASFSPRGIIFEYSTQIPTFDSYKKGYYFNGKRALFKFIYVNDSSSKYLSKTNINNDFTHLSFVNVFSPALVAQYLPTQYTLSGSSNPAPQTINLPAGGYVAVINGANGGSNFPLSGGAGGAVADVFVITKDTSFTFFTGSKGFTSSDGHGLVSGAAGGGSGSFIFSPEGYFLVAGGGGGAGSFFVSHSYSALDIKSGGGAGGSIGGGGGGGPIKIFEGTFQYSSSGGKGGGYNGETDEKVSSSLISGFTPSSGFNGLNNEKGSSGKASFFDLQPPNDWLNTNNSNGRGGDYSANGNDGGNNRNSFRGNTLSEAHGSIVVYKIF